MASGLQPTDTGDIADTVIPRDIFEDLERLGVPAGSYSFKPLSGMWRVIARRMADAAREAPHFPLNMQVEIDHLLSVREGLDGVTGARWLQHFKELIEAPAELEG